MRLALPRARPQPRHDEGDGDDSHKGRPVTAPAIGELRAWAVATVARAVVLCESVRAEQGEVARLLKSDRSPVTMADFGVQAIVSHLLAQRVPEIPLVAEEDTAMLAAPDATATRAELTRRVSRLVPGLDEAGMFAAIGRGNHAGGPKGAFWTLIPSMAPRAF